MIELYIQDCGGHQSIVADIHFLGQASRGIIVFRFYPFPRRI